MSNILYISKANSIPFAKREVSNYKTEDNTLSFEGKQALSEEGIWYFQPNNKPVIQIQSNLNNIKAEIYKNNIKQEEINAVLKIENLNQNITLDCDFVNLDESVNVGIKFSTGNVYDNANDLNVIDTFSLNGNLPEFTRTDPNFIGKTITVNGVNYTVLSILYDEIVKAWCIEVNSQTLPSGATVMTLNYDIEQFNIYEIPFDFENYNNSELFILISADNGIETFYQVSEKLSIGFFERMIEVQYRDGENKDIWYATGIKHLLWLEYDRIIPFTQEESENQLNDDDAYLIDTQVNEGNEFFLTPIVFKKYRQLALALSHSELFIDSIGYVKEGPISKEDNGESNLVDVSFRLIKSNADFETFVNKTITGNYIFDNGGFVVENDEYLTE